MAVYNQEQTIGEYIRQLRRQRNLTQTQLGGIRFSKSYVSAVERNSISPSPKALAFFAEQLGQSTDYFTLFAHDTDDGGKLPGVERSSSHSETASQALQDEEIAIFDILLKGGVEHFLQTIDDLPALSQEMIDALPPPRQAHYFFLMGLRDQKKGEYARALDALERALTLVPVKQHPAILDAVGSTHSLLHASATALSYHLRAFHALAQQPPSPLLLQAALHCGDDYRELGAYEQASEMYEYARTHLTSDYDMKTAGSVYLGLGYCTYAGVRYSTASAISKNQHHTEELEQCFQRAIGWLVQSRSIYQAGGDRVGETAARLVLAQVELNLSTRRRQAVQARGKSAAQQLTPLCASLLEDAGEQCRQVLVTWQDTSRTPGGLPEKLDEIFFVALAYLVGVFNQRAILARLSLNDETATRERALAAHLCQIVLASFSQPIAPAVLITESLSMTAKALASRSLALPRFPELHNDAQKMLHRSISQAEVYLAAGEVAEEFGRAATSPNYVVDCYTRADQFFLAALDLANAVVTTRESDPGYLSRCYKRYAVLLEERCMKAPELWEATGKLLLEILPEGLADTHQLLLMISIAPGQLHAR